MTVAIKGTPNEIAALVAALQGRQSSKMSTLNLSLSQGFRDELERLHQRSGQ